MSKRIALGTGFGDPVYVVLDEEQDVASLEEDLMKAAKTGAVVPVSGSVKGGGKGTVHINPSRALWWEIGDAPKQRVGTIY